MQLRSGCCDRQLSLGQEGARQPPGGRWAEALRGHVREAALNIPAGSQLSAEGRAPGRTEPGLEQCRHRRDPREARQQSQGGQVTT